MRIAGWIPRASSRSSSRPSASSSLACASSSRRRRGSPGSLRLGEPKAERERDEALLGAVVEVPLEPPPLGVAGLDDARARRGQLLAGLRVAQRDGDEVRELLEAILDTGVETRRRRRRSRSRWTPQSRPETTIGAATPELTLAATMRSWRSGGSFSRSIRAVRPVCATRAIAPPFNGSGTPSGPSSCRPAPSRRRSPRRPHRRRSARSRRRARRTAGRPPPRRR